MIEVAFVYFLTVGFVDTSLPDERLIVDFFSAALSFIIDTFFMLSVPFLAASTLLDVGYLALDAFGSFIS